jgi:ferredoxin
LAKRKIIEIERDKCDGCGLCMTACAEGALALDHENKAVLVREIYCDGLGACLDVCPTGALKVVEREGGEYDARATFDHVRETRGAGAASRVHGAGGGHARAEHPGCPGSMARTIPREPGTPASPEAAVKSRLSQWPIQLHLVSPLAVFRRERPPRRCGLHGLRFRRIS